MVFRILMVWIGVLFFVGSSQAVPFLYTFSGEIKLMTTNGIGLSPDPTQDDLSFDLGNGNSIGFNYGETLEYRFVVDTSRNGTCSPATSSQCDPDSLVDGPWDPNSPSGQYSNNYFYADLLSSSKAVPLDWFGAELNWGLRQKIDENNDTASYSQLSGGSAISVFTSENGEIPGTYPGIVPPTSALELDINDWVAEDLINSILGTNLIGQNAWSVIENNDTFAGNVYTALTLKSVELYDVPAPSTLILMASFLLIPLIVRSSKSIRV